MGQDEHADKVDEAIRKILPRKAKESTDQPLPAPDWGQRRSK